MALTQTQWYDKLKGWVPEWYFETVQYQSAHFMALAKLFSDMETVLESAVSGTFIMQSDTPEIEHHGYERSTDRLEDEELASYRIRVQSLTNQVYKAALKLLIDALLDRGECEIREDFQDLAFYNRSYFFGRDEFFTEQHYNSFTIVVEPQAPEAFSFFSRGYYTGRSNYMGNKEAVSNVYARIVEAVNKAKAFGILYRIVER